MNRGISISFPEPDQEDNKLTALTIGESYNNNLEFDYKSIYEKLGSAYYKYKEYMRANITWMEKMIFMEIETSII